MIVSPDKYGRLDGTALRIAQEIGETPIPIVPITRIEGFEFNKSLLSLDKYILLDYSELWWNTDIITTHLFGKTTHLYREIFKGEEWAKFDDFVFNNPPVIYFKRELLEVDRFDYDNVYPIDYPCWLPEYPIDSVDKFNSRPINCFFYWGRSHEDRVKFHADIWDKSGEIGVAVCDNMFFINQFLSEEKTPNKWVTLNIPHYSRQPIETIMQINGLSKLSVSLPGSGKKCFRTTGESPVNSVLVKVDDGMAYSYKWEHMVNCVSLSNGLGVYYLNNMANFADDLYFVYLTGVETVNKYRIRNYVENYINPIIKKHC